MRKSGSEDVHLPEVVGSERRSCDLNPGLSTVELELKLRRALLYFSREQETTSFPKTGLQIGNPRAQSGPQMCCVWPMQCFLKIRKFYIIISISGSAAKPGRFSNLEPQHGDARVVLRSSWPLLSLCPSQTLSASTVQFSVSLPGDWHWG